MEKAQYQEISTQQAPQNVNPFDELLPTAQKMAFWVLVVTGLGAFVFPFMALSIDQEFSQHFWVLTVLDIGLFGAMGYFMKFLRPNTTTTTTTTNTSTIKTEKPQKQIAQNKKKQQRLKKD